MDTSEESVFLHISNHGPNTPLGNIFISDGSGRFYSLSLENVLRGQDFVDFEKVNSLEGVFISNRFDIDHTHDSNFHDKFKGRKFTEAEIQQERVEKMKRLNGRESNMNAK